MEEPAGSVNVLVCSFLMMVCMFAAYLTKKFHVIYLLESASALLLGVAFGGVGKLGFDAKGLRFSPLVFFYGLLPIIIFNAGYSLKKKDFFRNFTTIVLLAVVGKIISTLVYGLGTYFLVLAGLITHMTSGSPLLESLKFGSLISANDPVVTLSIFQGMDCLLPLMIMRKPISSPMKVMMWMCGLRGPIAYALCVNLPTKNSAIETITLFIVVTTTLVFGVLTPLMAKGLGLTSDAGLLGGKNRHRHVDVVSESRVRIPSTTPHRVFKWLDRANLKPIFGGRDGVMDMREPLNDDDDGDTSDSDSDGRHGGGQFEGLSDDDDDESFKYPDVTLFEMGTPAGGREGPPSFAPES